MYIYFENGKKNDYREKDLPHLNRMANKKLRFSVKNTQIRRCRETVR
jgi:hypothetical protein